MSELYRFLLGVLCVWRITHLLHAEDGPWDLLARLREKAGEGFWASLLDCFYCLSLWVSAPLAYLLGATTVEKVLLWPGLSAAAILLERATSRDPETLPATYWEDPVNEEEEIDDVLRTDERSSVPEAATAPEDTAHGTTANGVTADGAFADEAFADGDTADRSATSRPT